MLDVSLNYSHDNSSITVRNGSFKITHSLLLIIKNVGSSLKLYSVMQIKK